MLRYAFSRLVDSYKRYFLLLAGCSKRKEPGIEKNNETVRNFEIITYLSFSDEHFVSVDVSCVGVMHIFSCS